MYTIPTDFELNKLSDSIIVQICFSANTINLFFENIGFVQIEGGFTYIIEDKIIEVTEIFPVKKDWGLLQLLEKKVKHIVINENRTDITIDFEGNTSLTLLGNPYFESYIIRIEGREIIV